MPDPEPWQGCDDTPQPVRPTPRWTCDVYVQDCHPGYKCAAYDNHSDGDWDSHRCVEIIGDGQLGDPCTADETLSGVDDCGKGLMCWYLDENFEGTCVEQCTGPYDDPVCGPPDTLCVVMNDASLILCLPSCDPLLQDCDEGDTCIGNPMGGGFVCVTDASDNMAPAGTPCEFINVCDPGLFCTTLSWFPGVDCQESLGCCAPFCDLNDPNACEGLEPLLLMGQTAECVPAFGEGQAPEGLEHVGGCVVPMP